MHYAPGARVDPNWESQYGDGRARHHSDCSRQLRKTIDHPPGQDGKTSPPPSQTEQTRNFQARWLYLSVLWDARREPDHRSCHPAPIRGHSLLGKPGNSLCVLQPSKRGAYSCTSRDETIEKTGPAIFNRTIYLRPAHPTKF